VILLHHVVEVFALSQSTASPDLAQLEEIQQGLRARATGRARAYMQPTNSSNPAPVKRLVGHHPEGSDFLEAMVLMIASRDKMLQ
jgi:hypothetical protein